MAPNLKRSLKKCFRSNEIRSLDLNIFQKLEKYIEYRKFHNLSFKWLIRSSWFRCVILEVGNCHSKQWIYRLSFRSCRGKFVVFRDENGYLKYVDFSYSNAYDTLIRPFNSVINAISAGQDTRESTMESLGKGMQEGISEKNELC